MMGPRPKNIVRSLFVFAAVLVVNAVGCGGAGDTCVGDETLHVKIAGSCAGSAQEIDVSRFGCRVSIAAGFAAVLPAAGAVDQSGHVLRQGGWQIYGCTVGEEPCPGKFRRCSTRRVDWQLDMTCVDESGAVACQATMTE